MPGFASQWVPPNAIVVPSGFECSRPKMDADRFPHLAQGEHDRVKLGQRAPVKRISLRPAAADIVGAVGDPEVDPDRVQQKGVEESQVESSL